ncbi:MAG TPA: hypothetical protein PK771_08230, partial [Spirochaetota bacterium]|nr:hypothetical protein [Spirochaetota bacterium]
MADRIDAGGVVIKMEMEDKTFQSKLNKTKQSIGGFGNDVGKMLTGLALKFAAIFAVGQIVAFGKQALKTFREGKDTIDRFNQTLKNAGMYTKENIKELEKQQLEIQKLTNYGDEISRSAQTSFVRLGMSIDNIKKATQSYVDLLASGKSGQALESYLRDPLQYISKFQREYQINLDKSLMETMSVTKQQEYVLDQIQKKYGGMANIMADPFKQINNWLGDTQELIGEILFDNIKEGAEGFRDVLIDVYNIIDSNKDKIKGVLGDFIEKGKTYFNNIKNIWSTIINQKEIKGIFSDLGGIVKDLFEVFVGVSGILKDIIEKISPAFKPFLGIVEKITSFIKDTLDYIKEILKITSSRADTSWVKNVSQKYSGAKDMVDKSVKEEVNKKTVSESAKNPFGFNRNEIENFKKLITELKDSGKDFKDLKNITNDYLKEQKEVVKFFDLIENGYKIRKDYFDKFTTINSQEKNDLKNLIEEYNKDESDKTQKEIRSKLIEINKRQERERKSFSEVIGQSFFGIFKNYDDILNAINTNTKKIIQKNIDVDKAKSDLQEAIKETANNISEFVKGKSKDEIDIFLDTVKSDIEIMTGSDKLFKEAMKLVKIEIDKNTTVTGIPPDNNNNNNNPQDKEKEKAELNLIKLRNDLIDLNNKELNQQETLSEKIAELKRQKDLMYETDLLNYPEQKEAWDELNTLIDKQIEKYEMLQKQKTVAFGESNRISSINSDITGLNGANLQDFILKSREIEEKLNQSKQSVIDKLKNQEISMEDGRRIQSELNKASGEFVETLKNYKKEIGKQVFSNITSGVGAVANGMQSQQAQSGASSMTSVMSGFATGGWIGAIISL